jgi:hypothetical protein
LRRTAISGGILAAALVLWAAPACQLFVDVGGLSNGQCAAGYKLCDGKCQSESDPKYGCNSPSSCVPCVFLNEYGMCDQTTRECVPAPAGCIGNFRICATDPRAGCTVDVYHDPTNCGTCGKICPTPDHGIPGCSGGVCGVGGCTAPYEDCDHRPDNGCEVDEQTDPANCGACGVVCKTGERCTLGVCQTFDASAD